MHKKYFSLYAIAVVVLIAIYFSLLKFKAEDTQLHIDFLICAIFFAVLSPLLFLFGVKGLQSKNNIGFMSFFYGSFMIKLFLSLGFVMVYLSQIKHVQWSFIAVFGLCYFLFSGIETTCLMMATKKKD